jgi:hypothetical protein
MLLTYLEVDALYNVSDVLSQYDTSVIFQKEVDPN